MHFRDFGEEVRLALGRGLFFLIVGYQLLRSLVGSAFFDDQLAPASAQVSFHFINYMDAYAQKYTVAPVAARMNRDLRSFG